MATTRIKMTPPQAKTVVKVPEDLVDRYKRIGFRVVGEAPANRKPRTKDEWLALAAEKGVEVPEKATVDDIKAALEEAESDPDDGGDEDSGDGSND